MLKVYLTVGLPASGKTTWAKQKLSENPNGIKRINKDDLRAMLDDSKWSPDAEKFIIKTRDNLILESLRDGKHVVVDDTNLHPKHEKHIRDLVTSNITADCLVEVVDFRHVGLDECISRDAKRAASVGAKVIRKMHRDFIAKKPEPIMCDKALPDTVICDLDGTLTLLNGRDPYDASTCASDVLNLAVYGILKALPEECHVILMSGREERFRAQTLEWLKSNRVCHDGLFMRATGDNRKDAIVKFELYEKCIKGKFNVNAVFDDRLQVCRMWHELGLPLFRVGDPDADF